MKRLLLLCFLLLTNVTFAQNQPAVYKSYFNNEDMYIIDNLVLSTDGLFFAIASCECGKEYYGKGKWQIKGSRLYLKGFDSTKAFPHATVEKISADSPTDSVTISGYDYFGKPLKSLLVELIYRDTSSFQSMPEFVDQTGKLTVSKKDYSGFYLIYEAADRTGLLKNKDYYYFFESNTKEIVIRIDFAAAGFDRQPIPFNYGNRTYKMRKGNLYGKGNKPVFVTNPYNN